MRFVSFAFALVLLIGCGGGGGGGSSPSAPAPQNITVSLTASADSAEVNSSITLTWSSTLATSCSASGAWSGSKGTSGSESITVGVGGSNTFSLSCSATGANSGSASTSVTGLRYFDGTVFDGYIRGAEVFVDTNDNLTLDSDESSVTTDNQGGFTKLLYDNGTLVSIGGIDSDTGADLSKLTLVHKLEGYEASKLASPFTTLIAYMDDASNLNAALGIDASINLLTTDPIPNLGEGIYDQMYEQGNQLTVLSYTLQNHSNAVDSTSALYFQAIADQLQESYAANQAVVDIEDPSFISNVIDKVETARETTFSSDVKTNLNTVLSSTIPLLKVYADSNTTASVQRFAFSTLQNDVQDSTVMIGNASATLLKYENNVFEYVASDQGIDESVINPDFNFAPVITFTTFSAAENQTSIGNIAASDADGDSLTYSISGSEISISSTGVLTFVTAPDYETKNSYSATVTVSDGTDSVTQVITVNVIDVDETVPNEAPVITSSATFSAAENQTAIGTVTATDADGDSLTYSISGSEINISSTGVLTFVTAPDYETKNSYTATVTVSDGDELVTQTVVIEIINNYEPPQCKRNKIWVNWDGNCDFNVESVSSSYQIPYLVDSEYDLYFELIDDHEYLNLSNTGLITLKSGLPFNSVQTNQYVLSVRIQAINKTSLMTSSTIVTGIILNVSNSSDSNSNQAPIISSTTFSVDENQTAIGSIVASDPDGDSLNYSITGNEIKIDSSSGILTFVTAPDYETKNSYTATVTVSDGTDSVTQVITVNVIDVDETVPNEAPVITSSATFSAAENQTAIGTVTATDADGDSLTYSISGSEINISSSGVLTFVTAPDYETKNSYTATVTVSDGTDSVTQVITVNVIDVDETVPNEAPVITSSATFSAAENQTAIGTVTATDADGDSLTYSTEGQEINISSSGVLTFDSAPDYETKNTYTTTVTVSDGTESTSQNITVNVTDVDENVAPTITSSATFSAAENQTTIGQVIATDADGDSLTYSISGSEINISSSGVLTFVTAPDYETKNTYTTTVTVSDGTESTTQNITVNVTNVNDNAPVITSATTFSLAENNTAIGSVTATDADGDSLTYSISGSEINISSSGVLTFVTAPDYETKNSYTATVTVSDGAESTTQNITVNVTDVDETVPNEAPVIASSATFSAAENQTTIGQVIATDADGDSLTYSVSGSEINISSSGVLTFASAPDYETKNSYTATVTVSDGTASTTQNITVNVTDVNDNAPVITSAATFSAAENQTAIGTVTATDADGDSLTYSVSGSEINISSSGVLTFASAPDYETKNTYTSTVTVSDGTASSTQNITVNVTNANDNTPIITSSSSFYVDENSSGVIVGTVTATDADGDEIVFSSRSYGAPFAINECSINSSTGELTCPGYNYEVQNGGYVYVEASDGVNKSEELVTIFFNNVSDEEPQLNVTCTRPNSELWHPTVGIVNCGAELALSNNYPLTYPENSLTSSSLNDNDATMQLFARDADYENVTFSTGGTDGSLFNVVTSCDDSFNCVGEIFFKSSPDYETKNSYSFTVIVDDGTYQVSNPFNSEYQLSIVNVNEAPVITSAATFSAAENQIEIGTVIATDADGDSLTFSISGSEINISSSGVLTFDSAPDYETKNTYTTTVTVSDGTDSVTQVITVSITDVDETVPNEAPVITSSATFSAAENQTAIGSVTATDADGDSLTYSISGSEINISSSGVLTFASAPDYETKNSYTATVTVSDGTASVTQDITVNVTNVIENVAPIISSSATFSAAENQTAIGSVTATDADGDSLTYSISGSEINISSSGVLTFASAPDYETKNSYTATVTVSDGTASVTQDITVNVTNVIENVAPIISSSATFSAAENQTAIGSVTATDADGDSLTYSISGSEINISSSGVLTFASAPDYETKNSYTATVTVSDGTASVTQDITVNVTNVIENVAPIISSSATFSAAENQTAIGSVTATDADGDSLTYSISGSEINISSSGVLTFASAPDYETKNSYTATVTVSDGTASVTQDITVNVTNVIENVAPIISSSATFSAAENQTAIGSVTATDADGDSLTYSISGSEINISSSGVLTFASAPDYETKNSYTATVTVSDGTDSTTQDITVNITDVNEAPIISSSATFSAAENQTAIGSVTATDADGDSLTYSISGSEINISSSGVLTFATAPDYEIKSSYSATITASDGSNSSTQTISVNVNNLNEVKPSLSLSINAIKSFTFSWSDTDDATSYKLLERVTPSSSYSQIGNDINQGAGSYEYIAPLHTRVNASYVLQACYNNNCIDSDAVSISGNLATAIGYIKASNSEADDAFGRAIALSGDGSTLAIGSTDDSNATGINGDQTDNSATSSGAVYVFIRNGSSWSQQAYIKASNTFTEYSFGASVSLSDDGNTLAVGQTGDKSNSTGVNGDDSRYWQGNGGYGSAFIFTRSGSTWSQQAYIKASNPDIGDNFGASVSISGDGMTLAVGAPGEDGAYSQSAADQNDNSASSAGAVYVFALTGSTWSQQAYLKDGNSIANDSFGNNLSLSDDGDTLAISRIGWDAGTGGNGAGSVLVFYRTNTTWDIAAGFSYSYSNLIASNPDSQDRFGDSLSLSGDGNTLAVAAPNEDSNATGIGGDQSNNSLTNSGAVYIFTRSGKVWSQQAYLKSSSTGDRDYFGTSVSLSDDGNTLVASSYLEDGNAIGMGGDTSNNSATNSGAAFVFSRTGSSWSETDYVKSNNTEAGDCFGRNSGSVSISDDGKTLAVGNYCDDSNANGIGGDETDNTALNSGAVYIY